MSDWISVKSSLPDINTDVLVYSKYKYIGIAKRIEDLDCPYSWIDEHDGYIDSEWLTHWMPLPEPPNVE